MSCPPRYKLTKASGDPYTCRFCHQEVMLDVIYSRYVNMDESVHKCDRKKKHFSDKAYAAAQTRRERRLP